MADYGAPAFLKIGSRVYVAFLDPPVNDEGEPLTDDWDPSQQTDPVPAKVYELREAEATEVDDTVIFDFEDQDEDEDEEDEEEDEEEEEEEGVQAQAA